MISTVREWLHRVESGHPSSRISQQILTNSIARDLRLQLAFQLVQKAPVGVFDDELLRGRLNQPRFAEPQRIETEGVLRVVIPPHVIAISLNDCSA